MRRASSRRVAVEHDHQQVHHVQIINPPCHPGQQLVMPDVVKIAAEVDIYNASAERSLGPPGRPLHVLFVWGGIHTIPVGVCLEDRLRISLSAHCTTLSRVTGTITSNCTAIQRAVGLG